MVILNRKLISTLVAVGISAVLIAQTGVFVWEARMSNGAAGGKAKYKVANRAGRVLQEELEFEAEDLAPNTSYNLTLGGSNVGTATTDGLGAFQWSARNRGVRRWNAGTGTIVTVVNGNGTALSGTLHPQ